MKPTSVTLTSEAIPGLNKQSTAIILISSGVLLTWSLISSILKSGPVTASMITYGLYLFYWVYTLISKNPLVLRLLIFGTIAGFLELVADHYLVSTINSLVYPGGEPMLWDSPAYMPFAWSNVLLQLSFIGVLLTQKYQILLASVILCIGGGMYIPVYEHLARDADWWWYHPNTLMVLNAPVYVILCEALISASLPLLIFYSEHGKLAKTVGLGILGGIWIIVSAWLAFQIAG